MSDPVQPNAPQDHRVQVLWAGSLTHANRVTRVNCPTNIIFESPESLALFREYQSQQPLESPTGSTQGHPGDGHPHNPSRSNISFNHYSPNAQVTEINCPTTIRAVTPPDPEPPHGYPTTADTNSSNNRNDSSRRPRPAHRSRHSLDTNYRGNELGGGARGLSPAQSAPGGGRRDRTMHNLFMTSLDRGNNSAHHQIPRSTTTPSRPNIYASQYTPIGGNLVEEGASRNANFPLPALVPAASNGAIYAGSYTDAAGSITRTNCSTVCTFGSMGRHPGHSFQHREGREGEVSDTTSDGDPYANLAPRNATPSPVTSHTASGTIAEMPQSPAPLSATHVHAHAEKHDGHDNHAVGSPLSSRKRCGHRSLAIQL